MQLNLPVLEHITLVCNGAGWSTSPRAYHAWWSVQSPDFQMSGLVDLSPSVSCSVVGTVPRLSNERAGRPVPERIILGGRYSPQTFKWAGWSTSPRAYHARWSVQSPDFQMGWSTSPRAHHARWSVQYLDFQMGWSTSPRAYHARWSVQAPDFRTNQTNYLLGF